MVNRRPIRRPKHNRVWKKGILWIMPRLAFKDETWNFIQECMDTIRYVAQDETISDSKCIEFMAAEFAASYGIETKEGDDETDI